MYHQLTCKKYLNNQHTLPHLMYGAFICLQLCKHLLRGTGGLEQVAIAYQGAVHDSPLFRVSGQPHVCQAEQLALQHIGAPGRHWDAAGDAQEGPKGG